ncbi:MAG: MazG nucleotide pyrophosphohydrolase domain-containing protein [Cetobacterium sp.]|uniref:MazG nucleotide pyrophosphohydrolase domain-containing protein n=1 Tax=Cetobacterium sp. TaxID=2071632 RepID=UPI003F3330D5
MFGIKCFHKFKKFEIEKCGDVVYLECEKCKKRYYKKIRNDRWCVYLDKDWLAGKTEYPKLPKKPLPAKLKMDELRNFGYFNNFYLEPNQSLIKKENKFLEEVEEAATCILENSNKSELAQELLDVMLTAFNLLKKLEKEDYIDLKTELKDHKNKLDGYVEQGKYKK